jgi:arylsulfatase A-like enzyme
MNTRSKTLVIILTLLFSVQQLCAERQPNIIFILADDLGYGDLGCYGQEIIQTPNIDRLAAEGVRFTDHYAGSTVCAPSRSVLMTGLHSGHTQIRGNSGRKGTFERRPEGQISLPASALTVAEVLSQAGYRTGAFGKWGLGFVMTEGDPLNQGFDTFFGYNCQSLAHRYYPPYLWADQKMKFLKGNDTYDTTTYAPDVIQEEALDFIRESGDEPFFLFYPHIMPHAELIVPEDDPAYIKYAEQFGPDPFKGSHWRPLESAPYGPNWDRSAYAPQEYPQAAFAAMIERMDRHVGEIMALLEEQGLAEDTIVIFTSDNGPHSEGGIHPSDFKSGGGLRGQKRDLYEGGIRVPFIVNWPGKIEGGRTSGHVSAFYDIMPTFAELAGAKAPSKLDGLSMVPSILGKKGQATHAHLYWEFHEDGGKQAVRMGDWKAVRLDVSKNRDAPIELYNLKTDLAETRNVAEEHPEVVEKAAAIMADEHLPSPIFVYDWEL